MLHQQLLGDFATRVGGVDVKGVQGLCTSATTTAGPYIFLSIALTLCNKHLMTWFPYPVLYISLNFAALTAGAAVVVYLRSYTDVRRNWGIGRIQPSPVRTLTRAQTHARAHQRVNTHTDARTRTYTHIGLVLPQHRAHRHQHGR